MICQWYWSFSSTPLGRLALALASAVRTSSSDTPRLASAPGSTVTRTAGSELPPTVTSPTPSTCDSFCATMVEARSYIWPWLSVSDVIASVMIGASDGLDLWYVGLLRRLVGSSERAALMAACTSRAAPLMSRDRSNCSVTRVEPCELLEVISVTPAMLPSERSSGVATLDAMVSGLAPGRLADTEMVGMSICGSGATGNRKNDSMPASTTASDNSVVATGRTMKGADRITARSRRAPRACRASAATCGRTSGRSRAW